MQNYPLRIAITPGEPAGIGPDLVLQIAQQNFAAELVVIANHELLLQRAKLLNLPITLHDFVPSAPVKIHQPQHLTIIDVPLKNTVTPGHLDKANADYVLKTLQIAGEGCLQKTFVAVVTGPVHKAIINDAGIKFSGHTEFFAELAGVKEVVMMLMAKRLRVALVTTHLPLAAVAKAITPEKLTAVIKILQRDLQAKFDISKPKIFVAGLNPHAGESGKIGREEIDIIIPVLEKLRQENIDLIGPLPADTLFLPKNLAEADAFLAMYHDQGLPVLKFYGFDEAVNVTLGLPFIRTSVDHGTALELAGTGKGSALSFENAIHESIKLLYKFNR